MSDKEKKRFHEMADKDKKRYDSEMQNYVPPKGEKVRGKKRKQMKDPNAPKRSLYVYKLSVFVVLTYLYSFKSNYENIIKSVLSIWNWN